MSKQGTEAPDQPMPGKALKELFGQSHDRGRAGLPVMSLSMGRGLVPRNQDERRVETNLSDEQHRLVRAGELAYNMMRMWQGVCGLAEEDCLISPAYVVVRPLNGMDPKFSEYLLTYEETVAQFKLLSFGVVDDRLRLYFKDFERVRVRIPSPPAQRKIARILTTLDNLIENTEALIAKYQAIKQGMMHDLFSRGIDAHGQLRPSQAEAPDLYKQSELGWIPKEWTSARLGSGITAIQYGTSAPSHSEALGSCPVLRIPNIEQGQLQLNDLQYQTPSPFEIKCFGVSEGDILVIRTNGNPKIVGTCAIVTGHELPMLFASYLIRIRLNSSLIASSFLASFFATDRARSFLERRATTSAGNYNLNTESLRAMPIPFPSLTEQGRICEVIGGANRQLSLLNTDLGKLRIVKTGLMQDLLTGKVRVKVDELEEVADA